MLLYLFVFLWVAYLSNTRYYRRTPLLQKLGKLLGSQVTPLMLARSPKHHMAAPAASPRASLCSGEALGVEAAWFPEARVVCVTSASTDESALPAGSSVHLADGFCDSYWLVEGVKVIYLRLKQNRAVRHLHNRPQIPQRGYFHVFTVPKVMMSCIIGSWRLCLKSCWVSISPPLLLPSQGQIDAAKQHHNIL